MILTTTIDGLHVTPKNRNFTVSMGARMAEAAKTRKTREQVRLRVLALVGRRAIVGVPKVTLTRLSAGTLDRGAVWESLKSAWDGVADGLGLRDDRELQERGDVRQEKCPRGSCGVRIEIVLNAEDGQ